MADEIQDISAVVGIAAAGIGLYFLIKSQAGTVGGTPPVIPPGGINSIALSGRAACVPASPGEAQVTLSWTPSVGISSNASYIVLQDGVQVATVANGIKTWNSPLINAPQQGLSHVYTVQLAGMSIISNNLSLSVPLCAGSGNPPPPPGQPPPAGQDFAASNLSSTQSGPLNYTIAWLRGANYAPGDLEYVDIEFGSDPTFQDGQFVGYNTAQTGAVVNGRFVIQANVAFQAAGTFYWRVNTNHLGVWYPSQTAVINASS